MYINIEGLVYVYGDNQTVLANMIAPDSKLKKSQMRFPILTFKTLLLGMSGELITSTLLIIIILKIL